VDAAEEGQYPGVVGADAVELLGDAACGREVARDEQRLGPGEPRVGL